MGGGGGEVDGSGVGGVLDTGAGATSLLDLRQPVVAPAQPDCQPRPITVSNIDQIADRGWWMEAITTCPLLRAMRFM